MIAKLPFLKSLVLKERERCRILDLSAPLEHSFIDSFERISQFFNDVSGRKAGWVLDGRARPLDHLVFRLPFGSLTVQ